MKNCSFLGVPIPSITLILFSKLLLVGRVGYKPNFTFAVLFYFLFAPYLVFGQTQTRFNDGYLTIFKNISPTDGAIRGFTGKITKGSVTITNISSTESLSTGMSVIGTGIPSGATILTVINATSITITSAATSSVSTATLIFNAVVLAGNTTTGSATITNLSSTSSLSPGMSVSGVGIPSSAAILTVIDENSIVINANATATGSSITLSFNITQGTWGSTIAVEEYLPNTQNQTSPNFSLSLPSAGSAKIVCGATTTSNGGITRSENGRYLIIPGYNANLGDLSSSFTLPAIRTVNGAGTIGSGIQASASGWFSSANDYRGAASDDGTNFWTSGGSLGIRYSVNGTNVTTVSNTSTNTRVVNIFNGQLFYSTGSGTDGIYLVGAGKPTAPASPSTIAVGATSPYAFSVSPDGLTIYVCISGKVVRYTYSGSYNAETALYSGGSWSTASLGLTLASVYGVAVDWSGYSFSTGQNGAIVYACSTTTLVRGEDNGTNAITITTLRKLTGLNSFKQLAFSPIKQTVSLGANSPAKGDLTRGSLNQVLFQFNLSADEGNSTIRRLTLKQAGTATMGEGNSLLNFRLIADVNSNGIADPAEMAEILATGVVSGSNLVFSGINQPYIPQGSNRDYLVIADIAASASGTFIPCIISDRTINGIHYTSNLLNAGGSLVNIGNMAPSGNVLSIGLPVVTTGDVPHLEAAVATLSGEVTHDGGLPILERGFCYSTTGNVALADKRVVEGGSAVGFYSKAVAGLDANTQYFYKAYATNAAGTSLSDNEKSFFTLANIPAAPVVDNPTAHTLDIAVNGNENPSVTEFAIQETGSSKFVQPDGSLGSTPVWQTAAGWSAVSVIDLDANTEYTFQVKARNGAGVETAYGSSVTQFTLAYIPSAPKVTNPTEHSLDVEIEKDLNTAEIELAIQEVGSARYVQLDGSLGEVAVWQTAAVWSVMSVVDLDPNAQYRFHLKARNGAATETTFGSEASFFTAANVPLAPTLNNPTVNTLDLIINGNDNPVSTEFAIQEAGSNQYVQTDGALGVSPVWQTANVWSTITLIDLARNTAYGFQVKARNQAKLETTFGEKSTLSTTIATGLNTIHAQLPISVINGTIVFSASAGELIQIIDASGQRLVRKPAIEGINTILVSVKGMLLVGVGNRVAKVVL